MGEIVEVRVVPTDETEPEVRQLHNHPIRPFFVVVFVPGSPATTLSVRGWRRVSNWDLEAEEGERPVIRLGKLQHTRVAFCLHVQGD